MILLFQTPTDALSILKDFGFPVALILGFLWFISFRVWPWITVRWEKREEASRAEREHMVNLMETQLEKTQLQHDNVLEPMVKNLENINDALGETVGSLRDLRDEVRSNK